MYVRVNKIEECGDLIYTWRVMRTFGHIDGTLIGDIFDNRVALAKSGIHPPTQAGISGGSKEGADSIVLSGGYEDDEDFGNEIIYTGAGGRDENTGKQIADQQLIRTNLALAKNRLEGLPVRVTRSYKHKSPYSPKTGYEYAGLYNVVDYWYEKGRSGFKVWRYKLILIDSLLPALDKVQEVSAKYGSTKRTEIIVQRIIRDSAIAKKVKQWHNYQCQVCGIAINTLAGLYAEAAHIQPLGKPHSGPDTADNILCLCPNHHVMFDNGVFSISNNFTLIGIEGELRTTTKHEIGKQFLEYHRDHYLNQNKN